MTGRRERAGSVRRRVLLSEGPSLTAREHVTVLGRAGITAEVVDSDSFALARWIRWSGRRHPGPPSEHVAVVGAALSWHGGLTLDYIDSGGGPRYIECNPRTVEPGNAVASGVDLPGLTVRLSPGSRCQIPRLPGGPGYARTG